uniref:Uncharacterized protein n=1 Tax=Ditylenchus dipsaci TaxID=166011 RepID=A0A915DJF6_9BILA
MCPAAMLLAVSYMIVAILGSLKIRVLLCSDQTGDKASFLTAVVLMNLVMMMPEIVRWLGKKDVRRVFLICCASAVTILLRRKDNSVCADVILNICGMVACLFECISNHMHKAVRRRNVNAQELRNVNELLQAENADLKKEIKKLRRNNRAQSETYEKLKDVCFWVIFGVGLVCVGYSAIVGALSLYNGGH